MTTEIRYHMLRPGQIVAQRTDCPIAYVPIGTIEWHGPHNPVGADAYKKIRKRSRTHYVESP
jgi:creatinine amidohydrolase